MRSGDVEETQRCPYFKPLPCTKVLSICLKKRRA